MYWIDNLSQDIKILDIFLQKKRFMLDKMAESECFKICHLFWNMKTHVIYISFCGILFFTWQSPGQWGQSLGIFIWGKIKFDLFIKRKPHISEEYNTQAVNITQIILIMQNEGLSYYFDNNAWNLLLIFLQQFLTFLRKLHNITTFVWYYIP